MTNKPFIYDRRTAAGSWQIIELISYVFDSYDGLRWSGRQHEEFGFYEKDKVSKSNIFLGIWYEAWEMFEIPLCIAVDYRGYAPVQKSEEVRKAVELHNMSGVIFKNYQNYYLVMFDHEFFNFENDAERVMILFEEMSDLIEIK